MFGTYLLFLHGEEEFREVLGYSGAWHIRDSKGRKIALIPRQGTAVGTECVDR